MCGDLSRSVGGESGITRGTDGQDVKLGVGEHVDTEFITEVLAGYGFEHVDYVYEPGQYAVRGSIIDVFSFASEYPYRIDFLVTR